MSKTPKTGPVDSNMHLFIHFLDPARHQKPKKINYRNIQRTSV